LPWKKSQLAHVKRSSIASKSEAAPERATTPHSAAEIEPQDKKSRPFHRQHVHTASFECVTGNPDSVNYLPAPEKLSDPPAPCPSSCNPPRFRSSANSRSR